MRKIGHYSCGKRGRATSLAMRSAAAICVIIFSFSLCPSFASAQDSSQPTGPQRLEGQVVPNLSIPIPTLQFSEITVQQNGNTQTITIPFLAQYIAAVYKYGVAIAGVVAAVMIMIGGLMYLTAGGDAGRVSAAKERITNAVVGLFLSVGAYVILSAINPDLVTLKNIQVQFVSGEDWTDNAGKDSESSLPDGGSATETSAAAQAVPEGSTPPPPPPTQQIEKIIQAYASCYGMDWRIPAAIARSESGLNAAKINGLGYVGLFQVFAGSCRAARNTNPPPATLRFGNCQTDPSKATNFTLGNTNKTALTDAEFNAFIGVTLTNTSLQRVKAGCAIKNVGNLTINDYMLLVYSAHNMGPDVLDFIVSQGACKEDQQLAAVKRYCLDGSKPGLLSTKRLCKAITNTATYGKPQTLDGVNAVMERKWRYGYHMLNKVKQTGVKEPFPKDTLNKDTCPLNTGKRVQ